MTNFKVGDRARCVDDSNNPGCKWRRLPNVKPEVGREYTVREIGMTDRGVAGIRLNELLLIAGKSIDGFYRASRFRSVVYDTTKAVEAIKATLPKMKKKDSVDAV